MIRTIGYATAALLISASAAFAQFRFSLTPIAPQLPLARALDINDSGAVVGNYGEDPAAGAFLWTPGGGLDLLPTPAGSPRASVVDINTNGAVLGWDNGNQVWIWHDDQIQLIPELTGAAVSAMNTAGQISGSRWDEGIYRPFRWQGGQETPLLTTEGDHEGLTTGINETGDVTGGVYGAPAVWYANGSQAGNTVGGYAYDISDGTNCVVGNLHRRGFIWMPPGFPQDMGDHPASIGTGYDAYHSPLAVNNVCHAVGFAEVNQQEHARAFFWTFDEGMMDLNALLDSSGDGWVLEIAYDMNNLDQIVGVGTFNGQQRAFLLTPTQIPEPVSLPAIVLASLLTARRRARGKFRPGIS